MGGHWWICDDGAKPGILLVITALTRLYTLKYSSASCFACYCNSAVCTICHAPLSIGFPRQAHWNGLPLPSPGIFLTQGSNLGLLHCMQMLHHLSPQGSRQLCNLYFTPAMLILLNITLYSQVRNLQWPSKVSEKDKFSSLLQKEKERRPRCDLITWELCPR